MGIMNTGARYIGPINLVYGSWFNVPSDMRAVFFFHVHFTTAIEAARRGADLILMLPEEHLTLQERLRRLRQMRECGEWQDMESDDGGG